MIDLIPMPGKTIIPISAKELVCYDRSHLHFSSTQRMVSLLVNGHTVEITQDGDTFNVRIDIVLMSFDLTRDQMNRFIQENT